MYIIQEIKTNGSETICEVPTVLANRHEVDSMFYALCGAAVNSNIEQHAIVTFTHEGFPIPELTKCFKHAPQPIVTESNEKPEIIEDELETNEEELEEENK